MQGYGSCHWTIVTASWGQTGHEWVIHCCRSWCFCVAIMQCTLMFFMPIACLYAAYIVLTLTVAVCEDNGHHVILMISTCLALNKMHYSVLPRHLHYRILMSCYCCHGWFGLCFGLGLELMSLESKPGMYNVKLYLLKWRLLDFCGRTLSWGVALP